jgi:hypothetical protein
LRDDALALLAAVKRRSEERVSSLATIEPAARLAEQEGSAYPLVTLRLGIAFHQAMIDVCAEFEKELNAPAPATRARSRAPAHAEALSSPGQHHGASLGPRSE